MAKILLVEDDLNLAVSVKNWLSREDHHTVDAVHNGKNAIEFLSAYQYDLVVLDWEMPEENGISVCKHMRNQRINTPVIMLTGRRALKDKTTGLDSGADDYLTKPFEAEELSARIRALLRRQEDSIEALRLSDLEMHPVSRQVFVSGKPVKLAAADFDLLLFLLSSPGEAFSAEALMQRAWIKLANPTVAGLRMSIRRIRKMLEANKSGLSIETVGNGYKAVG